MPTHRLRHVRRTARADPQRVSLVHNDIKLDNCRNVDGDRVSFDEKDLGTHSFNKKVFVITDEFCVEGYCFIGAHVHEVKALWV